MGARKGPGAVTLEPHKHAGVYIAKGKEHLLVTRNMSPGESVYGEKRVAIATTNAEGEEEKVEYRVWNPFRSKLAAGILGGLDNIYVSSLTACLWLYLSLNASNPRLQDWYTVSWPSTPYPLDYILELIVTKTCIGRNSFADSQIAPGAKVLYLGAASGSSVSHVSDIVGPEGVVYAVEFSHRSGRDLIGMAKKRTNVIRQYHHFPSPCTSVTFHWLSNILHSDCWLTPLSYSRRRPTPPEIPNASPNG